MDWLRAYDLRLDHVKTAVQEQRQHLESDLSSQQLLPPISNWIDSWLSLLLEEVYTQLDRAHVVCAHVQGVVSNAVPGDRAAACAGSQLSAAAAASLQAIQDRL